MHILTTIVLIIGVSLLFFGFLMVLALAAIAGEADTRLGYKDKID